MRDATKIDEYFTGEKTLFLIPLYQRKYAWQRKHCERLFADLIKVSKENRRKQTFITKFFFGIFVGWSILLPKV